MFGMHIESKSSALFQPPVYCTIPLLHFTKTKHKKNTHAAHLRERKVNINIRIKWRMRVRVRWRAIQVGLPTHFGTQRMSRVYLRWYRVPEAHRWSPPMGWGSAGGASHQNQPLQRKRRPRPHQPPPPSIPSTHTGDNSSPANRLHLLNIKHRHIINEWQSVDCWEHLFKT